MMDKDFFSIEGITALAAVPKGGAIHVIGVSGVAMAQMAILLAKLGYQVSGSDKEFYEPMGSLLRASCVKLREGYRAENLSPPPAIVLIGNAVSRDHVEVQEVLRQRIPYTIFPRLLHEVCIGERHSIAVTGTHGKTTTTALGAFVLAGLGQAPSYFVGGASTDLQEALVRGEGAVSIVEGDEYDSAFFAKVPKFKFYRPQTAIITSLEYDHADIYPNVESIEREFDSLMELLGPQGTAICCLEQERVNALVSRWKSRAGAPLIISYGSGSDTQVRLERVQQAGAEQQLSVRMKSGESIEVNLRLPGVYNALNATAILAVVELLQLDVHRAARIVAAFQGVRRRQEVRFDGAVTLIEDFAHHPTAVRETIAGIRARYPGRRLWAVFEPRSNTSRRRVFQAEYSKAFQGADEVLLCAVTARALDVHQDLLSVEELVQGVHDAGQGVAGEGGAGQRARSVASATDVGDLLLQETREGDVILLMSNGSFGGLPGRLESEFTKKYR